MAPALNSKRGENEDENITRDICRESNIKDATMAYYTNMMQLVTSNRNSHGRVDSNPMQFWDELSGQKIIETRQAKVLRLFSEEQPNRFPDYTGCPVDGEEK